MNEEGNNRSRYLQHLPAIYRENDFLGRFLHIFEDLVVPVEDVLEEIAHYFDPRMAPPSFLPWLAAWIDLALDENWPEERRRELIHQGTDLYRWRGTRRGLLSYLHIYAGVEPEIVEHLTPQDGGPLSFTVVLRVRDPSAVDEARVRSIIEAEKPAHTTYTLRIEGTSRRRTEPPEQPTPPPAPAPKPPAQPEPSAPPAPEPSTPLEEG